MKKVYILILQKPLVIKTYTSLVALIEDNTNIDLGASRSKLVKFDFGKFNYVNNRVIISYKTALSSGDVRRKKLEEKNESE
ncbi:hypothetical protein G7051_17510 [Dysgonomonas sp. HDW5B]|uniref:hypothetical protein n=1 Tax=Dysgonomonas sp. HDW5B TaxID=2714927 RepID=UPI001409E127|nr:hypothetical protein [Dysgonomonas sp. HDW5B]QIK56058.1 hypothetical protein G7051_17510 [Dysgonomonas sp. HDW5B]